MTGPSIGSGGEYHQEGKRPNISIVIPAYECNGRGAEFITELLDSIFEQEYEDYEVIVSDHSQNNEVAKVCEEFQDCLNILHFYNSEKRGNSSANMNAGIIRARGRYIKIMHQDDKFCSKDALTFIAEHTYTVSGFNHLNESGIYGEIIPPGKNFEKPWGCPSAMSFPNDNNLFDENLVICNDGEMHKTLTKKYGLPVFIQHCIITIRMHSSNFMKSKTTEDQRIESQYIINKHHNYDERYPLNTNRPS